MTDPDHAFIARLAHSRCGLTLEAGKEYLIESRLSAVAKKHGAASVAVLIGRVRASGDEKLATECVEALVTTETSFFRDVHPFETLRRTVLPELIQARQRERKLNLWCAASSSGQEPYTLALLLHEHFGGLPGWEVELLATDISHEMLQRSREGRYSQLEVNRGLPTELLLKHFDQEGSQWRLREAVRRRVTFRQLNLAAPLPPLPKMDLILLRNVMIYFDVETKKSLLDQMERLLQPAGYLLLGGAESTIGLNSTLRRVDELRAGFYRRAEDRT